MIFIRTTNELYSFDDMMVDLERAFLQEAQEVSVGEWQSVIDDSHPASTTFELRNVSVLHELPPYRETLARQLYLGEPSANEIWAEAQFQERVGGEPLNPPPSAFTWPHMRKGHEEWTEGGKFDHTYPERFWPKAAGGGNSDGTWAHMRLEGHQGIRFPYGDLGDVVNKLRTRPGTRQAYLPIYFPEDNGAPASARVPCSLGYHFLIRDNQLHCKYDIRSCDFVRHFRDDFYMAARLVQWVCNEVNAVGPREFTTTEVKQLMRPGELHMSIHSFHIFKPDMLMLRRKYAPGS